MTIQELIATVPQDKREQATAILAQYGPVFLEMARAEAMQYIARLMAGDFDAVGDILAKMSDEAFIARVKANSARWSNVAAYNETRSKLTSEMILRMVPVIGAILAGVVGL